MWQVQSPSDGLTGYVSALQSERSITGTVQAEAGRKPKRAAQEIVEPAKPVIAGELNLKSA